MRIGHKKSSEINQNLWIDNNIEEVVLFFEDYLKYQNKLELNLGYKWTPSYSVYHSPDDIVYEINSNGNLITLTSLGEEVPSVHLFFLFHRQAN